MDDRPEALLKGRRNRYEDTVLLRLHEVVPPGVKVTILADRGFGDQHLYAYLTDLSFDFIILFRGVVSVESRDSDVRPAHAVYHPTQAPAVQARASHCRPPLCRLRGVRQSALHEGRVVPRRARRFPHGRDCREALRPPLHH